MSIAERDLAVTELVAPSRRFDPGEGFVRIDGREMYRVTEFSGMRPFLMTVVSDCDLWMYVSSTGGLTAGRCNTDRSLFPYETDDALHQRYGVTGPITVMRIVREGGPVVLWEPFSPLVGSGVERNLYKSLLSDQIIFEEKHLELGLTFQYSWRAGSEVGWVRSCRLTSSAASPAMAIEILDGLLNLLPSGVGVDVQQMYSCLINAYTQAETHNGSNLATYSITSRIVDRAEAMESLAANVAWCVADRRVRTSLQGDAVAAFRAGRPLPLEPTVRGRRSAYLMTMGFDLAPGSSERWHIGIDASQDHAQVAALLAGLENPKEFAAAVAADVEKSATALWCNVASADGLQCTADRRSAGHHAVNVLFNNMRGGVFADGYTVRTEDFRDFVRSRNAAVSGRHESRLGDLNDTIDYPALVELAEDSKDPDLLRLVLEYLPITFSRRHGDPSRPWNRFDIQVRDAQGRQALNYQGNWRDIFQNWEAMVQSFPAYLSSLIAKFVNATIAEGYNPYRISRAGIDWEVPDPNNAWSHIGYWGDHQIIYLLKFLEASRRHYPQELLRMLGRPIFSYAHVPYRIKAYEQIVRDPKSTIEFDHALHREIQQRASAIGADGRLLVDSAGNIVHATLTEKLLVPLLSKLSNFVPGGGIWINTQRPEWNDANNALVGHGVSMVTLYYLRRYVSWCIETFIAAGEDEVEIATEVVDWMDALWAVFRRNAPLLGKPDFSDQQRREILDELGKAFCQYRAKIYRTGFTGAKAVSYPSLLEFLDLARKYLDHTIAANRREDGLYHSYNLLALSNDSRSASIDHLYEMLEGQVAVLSSRVLNASEAIQLLESLFSSAMFRHDQQSFMLYPERDVPSFMAKNSIPADRIDANPLLLRLLAEGDRSILMQDVGGKFRFHGDFRQAQDLSAALDKLARQSSFAADVQACRQATMDLFEDVFEHRRFTGRSGTMFGYEGIGCIYWHMVSKLLLAVQENYFAAVQNEQPAETVRMLANYYYRVRDGLGFNKPAKLYGAFPMDPYSHTPKHSGAQQPGMTGQVKEEILTRWGELGVVVSRGRIRFQPSLLRREEFDGSAGEWSYVDVRQQPQTLRIGEGSLAFTIAQVPVIYQLGGRKMSVTVHFSDGGAASHVGEELDAFTSGAIFGRTGRVESIHVKVPESSILTTPANVAGSIIQ